jgi:FkbM family methyltransferase
MLKVRGAHNIKQLLRLKRKINMMKHVANLEHRALRVLFMLFLGKKRCDKLIDAGTINIDLIASHFIGTRAFELLDESHFLTFSDGFRLVIAWQHAEWLPISQEITSIYLKPNQGDVVIDAGAHYGFYTLPASRLVEKDGLVIAFEPASRNYRGLLANLQVNKIKNVKPFKMALGDFDGEVKLYLGGHPGVHSIVYQHSKRFELVPIKRLDTVVNEFGLSKVNLIKLDTEGAELKILQGALSTIKRHRPRLTIAAYHYSTESEEIVEWLRENEPFYHIVRTHAREGSFVHAL